MCDYSVDVRYANDGVAPDTERKRTLKCDSSSGRYLVITLAPSKFRQEEILVSELSDMRKPGDYLIQVKRKAPKELGGTEVTSTTITIKVVTGTAAATSQAVPALLSARLRRLRSWDRR